MTPKPSLSIPDHQHLTGELARFPTLKELYGSQFFADHKKTLKAILNTPQVFSPPVNKVAHADFVRVVGWNIERGNRYEAVLHHLQTHPLLSTADLVFLNEVDVGMVRTGNRHVGHDLARELGMHGVYGAEYLEMTKGIGEELNLTGENTAALHGNAILSRWPLSNPAIVSLPTCFEPFHFHEKRFGRRIAIYGELCLAGQTLGVMTAHLEVRNNPGCRTRQMQAMLNSLEQKPIPMVMGGDWNTNTFLRGTRLRTLFSTARVLLSNPKALKRALRHPDERHEGLFSELRKAGFSLWEFNDDSPTCHVPLNAMEDAKLIPGFLRPWVTQRVSHHAGQLNMRLDWLAGRGVRAVNPPVTVEGLEFEGLPPSDHAPIVSDIWFL